MHIGRSLQVPYCNHRGELRTRFIIPRELFFGAIEPWHPEPTWLLRALDVERDEERFFALDRFGHRDPSELIATVELRAVTAEARVKSLEHFVERQTERIGLNQHTVRTLIAIKNEYRRERDEARTRLDRVLSRVEVL